MSNAPTKKVLVAVAVVSLLGLTACSGYNNARGIGDAPVGAVHEAPRQVWNNIDKFPNITAFCIGANGVYSHTRDAAPIIVANDANCAEGGILKDGG